MDQIADYGQRPRTRRLLYLNGTVWLPALLHNSHHQRPSALVQHSQVVHHNGQNNQQHKGQLEKGEGGHRLPNEVHRPENQFRVHFTTFSCHANHCSYPCELRMLGGEYSSFLPFFHPIVIVQKSRIFLDSLIDFMFLISISEISCKFSCFASKPITVRQFAVLTMRFCIFLSFLL